MKDQLTKHLTFLLVALMLCLSVGSSTMAQEETSATITGQVTDAAGAAVPNAAIVITNTATGAERRVQTNDEGNYTVFPLDPGAYTITVEQTGFKKYVVNATLNAKDRRPIDITLEVGELSQVVEVTSEAPLLQDSPTGQALVSGNQVTELPLNNRNFIRLLETIPGISSDLEDEGPNSAGFGLTSRANISINGLRRNAVNYLVDGVNNTDVGSNITLLSTPTVDSIKEFKVLSSNYTAEIGRSGGGSVIIVTRGGGNKYSGTLYEFVRNDAFNANNFFNNRQGRNPDGSLRADVPKLRYNNFGGTFSGPVLLPALGEGGKPYYYGINKTFFFVSMEARRVIRGVADSVAAVPSALERQGNFSATLGAPLCRQANNTVSTNCTAAGATPLTGVDTSGAVIQIRQNQIFRPFDNRPYAGNIVPMGDIDPRSLGLLQAFPLPNVAGTINTFQFTPINILNTRQEVFRIDHNFSDNHKIFGRYTRDTSETTESGGLFTGFAIPNVATTNTAVPGKVFAVSYTGIFSSKLVNEATFNFSGNEINSILVGRGRKSDYPNATTIVERFPENNAGAIPTITSRFSSIGALQGFSIEYANATFRDILTYTTGNHVFKFGAEVTKEIKNENTGNNTQGTFNFSALQSQGTFLVGTTNTAITGTGDSFASFLLGRANTYSESQADFRVNQRFGRREFFAQDSWRVLPNLTLDFGVRYQYFVPPYDKNNRIGSLDPTLYNRNQIVCTTASCATFNFAGSDLNNGIGIAGSTSRFGRSIIPADKNNFSPRVGLAYSPNFESGIGRLLFGAPTKSIIRAGYGFYYDQPLIGIFEQAAFTTPAFSPSESFTSNAAGTITFSQPNAGAPPGTFGTRNLVAVSPDFETPETQVWSLGIQREVFKNAVIDVSYVGTKGDKLIRRRNINFLTPAQTVAVGTGNVNAARPFVGYGTITYQETSSRSRYHGLLSSFNYRLANGFTITLAYTYSRTLTDSTNDRDAIDEPQNPLLPRSEYAEARTSRPHVFSASYVYEIPFFRKSKNNALRLLLGGYQISGITNIDNGAPVPRVTISDTLSGQRGLYPVLTGDPNGGLAGTIDPNSGLPFIFDPTVFATPANGQFGNTPRSFARLPGRNQTNLSLSKQFYFNTERTIYVQLRAEANNAFNQTQFTGIGTTFSTTVTNPTLTSLGRPTGARPAREFQFGAKFYF
jgi:hypothetical protein